MGEGGQIVRAAYGAFNRRDIDGLLAVLDPQVTWIPIRSLVQGGAYHGHAGVRRWFLEEGGFDEFSVELRELEERGERVTARTLLRGRGEGSGAVVTAEVVDVWVLRGSKVTRFEATTSVQAHERTRSRGKGS